MKKTIKTTAIVTLALMINSFTALTAQTKKIEPSKCTINWLCKKVTGQHAGVVTLKEASLIFNAQKITGGNFVVDMTSLTATDLTGEYLQKLNGHLKNEDFFNTTKFPTSNLVFKTVTEKSKGIYTVVADLTIKNITQPISFEILSNVKSTSTTLIIDRTKYDIKYGSKSFFDSLGDKAIDNEFELKINITL